ncbi:pimeloyl-ACP methyl ester carboxylesterase [Catenulispora sp. MAP12-49]|uniref:alpha/beta fold hydrolase n=1 Tax=Catenulispora sp. MAP12-49 TaxID=3156302 RepID=UPI0035125238
MGDALEALEPRVVGDAPAGDGVVLGLAGLPGRRGVVPLIDALARDRELITFDNTGVGASTGRTPGTVAAMADDAIAFLDALDLERVDLGSQLSRLPRKCCRSSNGAPLPMRRYA